MEGDLCRNLHGCHPVLFCLMTTPALRLGCAFIGRWMMEELRWGNPGRFRSPFAKSAANFDKVAAFPRSGGEKNEADRAGVARGLDGLAGSGPSRQAVRADAPAH